jgi:hypothetical protein
LLDLEGGKSVENVSIPTEHNARITLIKEPTAEANIIINEIKCVVRSSGIDFSTVSRIAFSKIKSLTRKLQETSEKGALSHDDNFENFLRLIVDVMFFLYSMDWRVRNTYTMTQILIYINRLLQSSNEKIKNSIQHKIRWELTNLIGNIFVHKTSGPNVELLNLLISLKVYEDNGWAEGHLLLKRVIDNLLEDGLSDYFTLMVLLHCIQNDIRFFSAKQRIERKIVEKITGVQDAFFSCELTLLLFDSVKCPYVAESVKKNLIESAYLQVLKKSCTETERGQVIRYISAQNWWFNWDERIELESVLVKKELTSPY